MPLDVTSERIPDHLRVLLLMDKLLPDESKWCKGSAYSGKRGRKDHKGCLFFGILTDARKALELGMYTGSGESLEFEVLESLIPERFNIGQNFNDDPDTTFEDIKALLGKAIEMEMSKVVA